MRRILPVVLLAASLASGCASLPSPAALGPSSPGDTTSIISTAKARIDASVTWLWQSYTRLKAAGVTVDGLQAAILDIEAAVKKQDLTAALDLYLKARNLVTKLAAGA